MPAVSAAVFDFDLTLADSTAGFHDCYSYAAAGVGLPPRSREAAGSMIGTPLHLAFVKLYGEAEKDRLSEFVRLWQERADAVMNDLTQLLPGAETALEKLSNAGMKLGIVSQKRRYRLEAVLERDGLLDCFDAILGEEDVPAFKPDPRGLLLALERLAVERERSLYVGDTTIDGETAGNAGVPFVAVLTGFASREALQACSPLAVLESVAGLPGFLGV